jgi:hypothetical protein
MLRAPGGGHRKSCNADIASIAEKEKAGDCRLLSFFVGTMASFTCDSPRRWQKLAL